MKEYIKHNNTYQVFSVDKDATLAYVNVMWGKQDFKCSMKETAGGWKLERVQIRKNNKWIDYAGVTAHGLTFEEVHWVNNEGEVYIELPKQLKKYLAEVCSEYLSEAIAETA